MSAMLVLTIVLCVGWVRADLYSMDRAEDLFESFIKDYKRNYASDEEKQLKFNVFKQNLRNIIKHNSEHGYEVMGINHFSDMSDEEFKNDYLSCTSYNQSTVPKGNIDAYIKGLNVQAPENFDWRDKGVVTAVKNQGGCGSCWAFSVVANVESQHAILHGQQLDLSEQQEVDCDRRNSGCKGGWITSALQTIVEVGGLVPETSYPYTGQTGICRLDTSQIAVRVTSFLDLTGASEENIKDLLIQHGPLAIILPADSFKYYKGNVLQTCTGPPNHALLLVGYGTDAATNLPYWIIKNSWSTSFGESGYLKLKRGNPNCLVGQKGLSTAVVA